MIYRENRTIAPQQADGQGYMKISAILYFAQEAAGAHCKLLGCDWDTLAPKGLFWAVMRHAVEINRLPQVGETVTVETWPMPTTRTCYPRSTAALDAQGNVLFRIHSLWILMDKETRSMVLPGKSGVTVNGILRGTELPAPKSLAPEAMEQALRRKVAADDLDQNGHMNNVRYLDWISKLLPQAECPKALQLCYVSEAMPEAELTLHWSRSADDTMHVEITEEAQNKRIFAAFMRFL